ncbi:uncharacterized protein LOC118761208 [Octopus sinensis]|uniref:Uncharacterized protein LOC118761208 n=1 Tax=Octopus sinensis TaxID=2607531 RepID=A0A7E6EIN8_9MOLL|nr:uncharacterized protein LOC118761208 [Octopus sinensis]
MESGGAGNLTQGPGEGNNDVKTDAGTKEAELSSKPKEGITRFTSNVDGNKNGINGAKENGNNGQTQIVQPLQPQFSTRIKTPYSVIWLPSGDPHQSLFRNYNFKREFQRNVPVAEAFLPPWCMILRLETIACFRTAEILLSVSRQHKVDVDRLTAILESICISITEEELYAAMKFYFRSRKKKTYADFLFHLAEDERSEKRALKGKFNTRESIFYTAIVFLHLENFKSTFMIDNAQTIFTQIPRVVKKILSKTCDSPEAIVECYILLLKASCSPYIWPVPKWNIDFSIVEENLRMKLGFDPPLMLPPTYKKGHRPVPTTRKARRRRGDQSSSVYSWNHERDISNKIPWFPPEESMYGTARDDTTSTKTLIIMKR